MRRNAARQKADLTSQALFGREDGRFHRVELALFEIAEAFRLSDCRLAVGRGITCRMRGGSYPSIRSAMTASVFPKLGIGTAMH